MSKVLPTLYYIHDPMCSWCWGFRPVWNEVQAALADKVNIHYLLGGLAPDTDKAMSESMQRSIRSTWQRIQQEIPGTEFNYDFWIDCQPRRSTYPSCRAVIACAMQRPELQYQMILTIQQAYYLQAKNPSDTDVLIELAKYVGLDHVRFARDLDSDECRTLFENELDKTRAFHVSSFPSLILSAGADEYPIHIDYTDSDKVFQLIMHRLDAFK